MSQKQLKYILIVGIVLFVGAMIAGNIIGIKSKEEYFDILQSPLLKRLSALPSAMMLILTVIVVPLLEESVFRIWVIKQGKVENNSGFTLFSSLLSFYSVPVFGITVLYIVAGYSVGISILVFLSLGSGLLIKNRQYKILTFTIFTGFWFSILHFSNYSSLLGGVIACLQQFGLSFILVYLGLRFGFVFTIIGHSLNNLLATLPLIFFSQHTVHPILLSGQSYFAIVEQLSPFSNGNAQNLIEKDTLSLAGFPQEIAVSLNDFSNDTMYKSNIGNSMVKYRLTAKSINNKQIDKFDLLKRYLHQLNIQTDTLQTEAYVLSVTDYKKCTDIPSSSHYFYLSLQSLTMTIRDRIELPVILLADSADLKIQMDYIFLKLKNKEEIMNYLYNEYGIKIEYSKNRKITIIRFFTQQNDL